MNVKSVKDKGSESPIPVKPENELQEAVETSTLLKDNESSDEVYEEVESIGSETGSSDEPIPDTPENIQGASPYLDTNESSGEVYEEVESTRSEVGSPDKQILDASENKQGSSSDIEKDELIQKNESPATFPAELEKSEEFVDRDQSSKDQYKELIEENVLYDEDKLNTILQSNDNFNWIFQQNEENYSERQETSQAALPHSPDTQETPLELTIEGTDTLTLESKDPTEIHLKPEQDFAQNPTDSKGKFFREKRHMFIKAAVFDEYDTFYKTSFYFLRTDPSIMNSLAFITKLVCTDCHVSNNPHMLLRSLGIIQALVLNPNCELTIQQLDSFTEHLLFCLLSNSYSSVQDTISYMIAFLIGEFTKGHDPKHKDLRLRVMDSFENVILSKILDFGIYCSFIDSVMSLDFVAVCLLMPKIFPKMHEMVGVSMNVLNLTKWGTRQLFSAQSSGQEFNKKMLEIPKALNLHEKLLNACELLIKFFFLENFTLADVSNALKSRQNRFSDNDSCWFKQQNQQLEPFFKNCLEYFGEALTTRLSVICTQYNCAWFLVQLCRNSHILTINNIFMDRGMQLRTMMNTKRKERKKENSVKPSSIKKQWLLDIHQIKKIGEYRYGFIRTYPSTNVPKRNTYEALQGSTTHSSVGSAINSESEVHSKNVGSDSEKNVYKSISNSWGLLSPGVQTNISVKLSSGSVGTATNFNESDIRAWTDQYLKNLIPPSNMSTCWLDKLCERYRRGRAKPMNWKTAGILDIFI